MALWYVVQTVGGQEKHVLDLINKLVDEELIQESFIPQYEVKKRIQGVWKMRSEVLLPGYIFVITDQPGKLREALRIVPKFTRLLGNNDMHPLDRSGTRTQRRSRFPQDMYAAVFFTHRPVVSRACSGAVSCR